ncbi:MAG: hypothetical protein K0M63_03910 [Weeksellaceae bacterium]|nr:hypothetical protein [Weeksellaceae bacterium]
MRRFLRLFSVFSLILTVQSCKSYKAAGAVVVPNPVTEVKNDYFSSTGTDYLYKAQIEIYGNDLSGILIMKKIAEDTHRVVMTTDFGNKMLDFEISQTNFKVNYLLPDLDKKVVKKFLEKDFRILLNAGFPVSESFEDNTYRFYSSGTQMKKNYLFYDKNDGLLKKIVVTENRKEKINFIFEGKSAIFADAISLIHKDFKLSIELNQITVY